MAATKVQIPIEVDLDTHELLLVSARRQKFDGVEYQAGEEMSSTLSKRAVSAIRSGSVRCVGLIRLRKGAEV